MFKVLHFTNTNISFILHRSLKYGTIKFSRVRKLSEFKITGVYSSAEKYWHTAVSDMLKKLYSVLLISTPIKRFHVFQTLFRCQ